MISSITEPSGVKPQLLFEDGDLRAFLKPPGFATVHQQGSALPSMAEWIGEKGLPESGLVHRLDTSTSGIVVAAKNHKALTVLSKAFRDCKIKKNYVALIEGIYSGKSSLEHYIGGRYRRSKKVTVRDTPKERYQFVTCQVRLLPDSKPSLSGSSLVEVEMQTGARHQIRAQLSAAGFPLAGDALYGSRTELPKIHFEPYPEAQRAFFLHAAKVLIPKEILGSTIELSADWSLSH